MRDSGDILKTIRTSIFGGPHRSDARRARAAVRTLALCSLALSGCLPGSLSLGDDTTGSSGGATTEAPPDVPPPDSTSTGAVDATTEGSSDDTGADLCPEGPPGWQWIERIGTEDVTETRTFMDLLPNAQGVVVLGEVSFPVLRRYDVSGELQWEQQGPSNTQIEDVLALPNGDSVVCGHEYSGADSLWLARYDSMGNEQWSVDEPNLHCRALDVTAAGDIVAGGWLDSSEAPEGETAVLRFDGSGAQVGSWIADLPVTFGIQRMVTVGEEVVMIAEYLAETGYWLGRLGANDQLLWGNSHDDMGLYSRALGGAVDPATGDIILVGSVEPQLFGPYDIAVWRFSADGTMQWQMVHELGGTSEQAGEARIAPDGTIVLAGVQVVDRITTPVLATLDPEGELLSWTSLVGGELEGADPLFANDMELDDCGGIYMSGWGQWGESYLDDDGWVGRYVPPRGL